MRQRQPSILRQCAVCRCGPQFAKTLVVEYGISTLQEREDVDRVLDAAALTYVAAAISTLLTVVYFLMRAELLGRSED